MPSLSPMQHRFGCGPAFTVGIEEEFQLLSAESYELVARCRPAAERLGCAEELDDVARISGRGEGASEQRRIQEEAGSLLAVAQWLARTTVADLN
jgi:glutamate---cysteine ligase / carboxylate-amine ligase